MPFRKANLDRRDAHVHVDGYVHVLVIVVVDVNVIVVVDLDGFMSQPNLWNKVRHE